MKEHHIAPCGMNCSLCLAYQRDKNRCDGCMSREGTIRLSCERCSIRNCEQLKSANSSFCYACAKFPCRRLRQLDMRYRDRYSMSMLENLQMIREKGLNHFLREESRRWSCPECGNTICVHTGNCMYCNPKKK